MPYVSPQYARDLERFPTRNSRSFHHFHYKHLNPKRGRGYSIYLVDGVYIPTWLHVPFVHRILGGGARAGSQPWGDFPNFPQRLAHWIFRLVFGIMLPFEEFAAIVSLSVCIAVFTACLRHLTQPWVPPVALIFLGAIWCNCQTLANSRSFARWRRPKNNRRSDRR